MSAKSIQIIQYGLGPIGNRVTQHIAERRDISIAAGIDVDPEKVGKDVGELAGLESLGAPVTDDADGLLQSSAADVVVLTTTSDLKLIRDQILRIVANRKHVVSTCEELSYPWDTNPDIAKEIDEVAKEHEVAVFATGVNPGFLMDFLPLALTGVCSKVESVTVERIQDAQHRRMPFQRKIGAGLSIEEFAQRVEERTLRHVGLTESMHMIAAALGWRLEKTVDIVEPIIANERTKSPSMTVETGDARGVQQTGRGWKDGKEVITLVFRAAICEPDPRDRILIKGTPEINSTIIGGVNGDIATCAITVNAIPAVLDARPGLRTMMDMAPISCTRPD